MSWEKKTIGELCQIEKGKIGIQKAIPGDYPLLVTAEERSSHNEYHFEGNAVVIPLVSSTGHGHRSLKRIHFQSGKFAVGNILCVVMPNDENILRADYLYRFLDLNREKELVGRMRGMANVTLPMKEIAQIEIPVPPIEAQIDFVEQYSILEEKSNDLSGELTHQLDLVKQLRKAFLREAMQGKLVPQDENDEPASVLLEKIKAEKERLIKEKKIKKQKSLPAITEDEIPFEIPENWVWCRLNDICIAIIDCPHSTPKYIESATDYYGIDTNCINDKGEIIRLRGLTKESYLERVRRLVPQENDIVYAREGSIGRATFIPTDSNICLGQRVMLFRPPTAISHQFLMYAVTEDSYKQRLLAKHRGMGAKHVNVKDIVESAISLPPLSEQQSIVAKLDELMQYCDDLEASIKESQHQNELLLQQVLREALEPSYADASDGRPKEKEVVG